MRTAPLLRVFMQTRQLVCYEVALQGPTSMARSCAVSRAPSSQPLGISRMARLAHSGGGAPSTCSTSLHSRPPCSWIRHTALTANPFPRGLGQQAFRASVPTAPAQHSGHAQHEAVTHASTAATEPATATRRRRRTSQEPAAAITTHTSTAEPGAVHSRVNGEPEAQAEAPDAFSTASRGKRRAGISAVATADASIQQQLLAEVQPQPATTLTTKRTKHTSANGTSHRDTSPNPTASMPAEPRKRNSRKPASVALPLDGLAPKSAADAAAVGSPPPPVPAAVTTTRKRSSKAASAAADTTSTSDAVAQEPVKAKRRSKAASVAATEAEAAAQQLLKARGRSKAATSAAAETDAVAQEPIEAKRRSKAASVAAAETDADAQPVKAKGRSNKTADADAEAADVKATAKPAAKGKRGSSKAGSDAAAPSKAKKAATAASPAKPPAPVRPKVQLPASPLAVLYPDDDVAREKTTWHRLTLPLSGRPYNPSCFTDAQAGDLRSAGIRSLFHLLTNHPRKHIHYNTMVEPGQEEQAVAVLATVKSTGTVTRAKGALTIGKFTVEARLKGSHMPATIQVNMFRMGPFGTAALYSKFKELPQGMQVLLLTKNLKPSRQAYTWECSEPVTISPYDKRHAWTRQLLGFTDQPQQPGSLMAPPPQPAGPVAVLPVYTTRSPVSNKDFFNPDAKIEGLMQRALRALESVHPRAGSSGYLQGAPLDATIPVEQADGKKTTQAVLPWDQAVHAVHAPKHPERLNIARASLAYHELYFLMLRQRLHRKAYLTATPGKAGCVPVHDQEVWQAARDSLPFKLTSEQERVLGEILKDMKGPLAMFRLLQGDVGCGKTVVAMLAMLATAATGAQALMLAPTEILASQHHHTLSHLITTLPAHIKKLLGGPTIIKPVLLTGSTKDKDKRVIMADLQAGQHRLVVSTHSALYTESWHKLGLVIIDEQHKFGLQQRQRLLDLCPTVHPHLLAMSATPIPRTLAQVIYGDMEVSIIQGKPPGRTPVRTLVLRDDAEGKQLMYQAVVQEVSSGGRAFIVYPGRGTNLPGDYDTDDEDDSSGTKKKKKSKAKASSKKPSTTRKTKKTLNSNSDSGFWEGDEDEELEEVEKQALLTAKQEFERLQAEGVFGSHQCVLLHGGMGAAEKEAAIAMHRRGTHPIMVCTSVVEVGVDVPDASIMVVQQADRFGLAQLHQMRGRVGRSDRPSSCLLMFNDTLVDDSSQAEERLQALVGQDDGFEIAMKDLTLRGAGALFSSNAKQSGNLDCSKLCTQELSKPHGSSLVDAARRAAIQAVTQGPDLDTRAAVAAYESTLGLVDAGLTGGAA